MTEWMLWMSKRALSSLFRNPWLPGFKLFPYICVIAQERARYKIDLREENAANGEILLY
jgi:hypothetical protein